MLGKIEGRRKGATEEAMVGWHHWLNGHEFAQTLGGGEGQGGLACCRPSGHKELDMTEQLNNICILSFPTLSAAWPVLQPLKMLSLVISIEFGERNSNDTLGIGVPLPAVTIWFAVKVHRECKVFHYADPIFSSPNLKCLSNTCFLVMYSQSRLFLVT